MFQKYLSHLYPGLLSSIVILAILWLTLAPHPLPDSDIPLFPHADKVAHALMFGFLIFSMVIDRELFLCRHYEQTGRMPRRSILQLLVIVTAAAFLGGMTELLQGVMNAGRGADIYDFAADMGGIILSVVVSPRLVILMLQSR